MTLRTPEQIQRMRDAGLVLWESHQRARNMVVEGATTREINAVIEEYIASRHATAMFKGVPGKTPYPAGSCISVNEQVVHGIPSGYRLRNGDIVGIDIGVKLSGWCADAAVTYAVGTVSQECAGLLQVTEQMLREMISLLASKTRWSQIVKKTSKRVHGAGYSIVEELVGHAIGQQMWERPQVPNNYDRRNPDFRIKPGLVLAIEPMVNMGTEEVRTLADGWTVVTRDGLPSAHFEHTVAVTDHGPAVLTCGPNGEGWAT